MKVGEFERRVYELGTAALSQAVTQSTFLDPGLEHKALLCLTSAVQAAELITKAAIIAVDPLKVFTQPSAVTDQNGIFDPNLINSKSNTIQASKIPNIYEQLTGKNFPNEGLFQKCLTVRNQLQHLYYDPSEDYQTLGLQLCFQVTDGILFSNFNDHSVYYHEDISIGTPDYIVGALARRGIKFNVPKGMELRELGVDGVCEGSSKSYKNWLIAEMNS